MPEYKRILVIRLSSLGDIILTSPFLKVLRQKFPFAQIDFCTKSQYAAVIRLNPNLNGIIQAPDDLNFGSLKVLRKELAKNSYDLVIDLHNNLKTFYLKFFLRLKSRILIFRKYSFRKLLLVKFKINYLKDLPSISARYINTLKSIMDLTENDLKTQPDIFTDEDAKASLNKALAENGIKNISDLICIVPGSKHFTKTYPAEHYAELINTIDNKFRFVLAGTTSDKSNIDSIKSKCGNNVYDLCGKLSLLELTELMKQCRLVISGDTGPMHIAESLNVSLLAVMGSSVREFGFYPQSDNSTIIENVSLKCRPCSHIGKEKCPKGHFKCMMEIKPEAVIFKSKEIINSL